MSRIALVLSGGGARGAYEVGVLRYLREGLPRQAGIDPARVAFEVICGTSVGAINGCFLAGTRPDDRAALERLAELWRGLKLEEVFRWSALQLAAIPGYVWRELRALRGRHLSWRLSDFLYPEALARLVRDGVD